MITQEIAEATHPTKALGEVATFLDHKRRPVKKSDRKEGLFPYYGANGLQGTIGSFIFDEPLILLAEDGGHFDDPDRGIAYEISGKTWVNNHAHVLKPQNSDLDLTYLRRVLENYDVRPFINGSTRSKLTKAQAERIPIPLPPLDEQRRIVAILHKADELRRMRKRTINLLDGLSQSIFLKMFDPNPAQCIPLKDVADLKRGPFGGALKKEIFVESGFLVYEQGTVISGDPHSGRYFVDKNKYLVMKEFSVQPDDILVTCSGTIGAVLRARNDFPEGIINQALLRIRPDATKLRPEFLEAYLKLDVSQRFFEDFARGTGLKNFPPMSEVKEMPIPLITMDIQDEFLARRRKTEVRLSDATESLSALKNLFSSLQSRAFSGQL